MRKVLVLLITILLAAAPIFSAVHHPAQAKADQVTLKMGLLPILDVLPFYVAQQNGYFDQEGIKIELVPVSSAAERDQLMLSGEIDGMLNDLVSTGIFNQDQAYIQVVALARRAYEGHPQFRILAAPGSNIKTVNDLKGVEIGISENSVIHYITQRILENAGLKDSDIKYRVEPNIPVRFQLLMEGSMPAVTLPDPMGQAAIQGGATLVADDTALVDTQFSQSVLSFRKTVIDDHPEAIEAFLRAWMHAADDINADPESYRDLWLQNSTVPDSVKDTYEIPPFPTYEITTEAAWKDTMQWLVDQKIIDKAPSYKDGVNASFLEKITPPNLATATEAATAEAGK